MTSAPERIEHFTVADDHLIRSVVPLRGRGEPYEHRCPRTSYEVIAHAAELFSTQTGDPGFTLEELATAAGTPAGGTESVAPAATDARRRRARAQPSWRQPPQISSLATG